MEDSESIFDPQSSILDDLTPAYDFFAAAGACRSMTLTTFGMVFFLRVSPFRIGCRDIRGFVEGGVSPTEFSICTPRCHQ